MNTLTDKRILVIGLGHMATALVKGLLKVDSISKKHIYAVTHGERSQNNAQELGINPIENTDTLKVDIVLLALKPQMMADVLPKYKHLVSKDTLFFSVAAGVSLDNITALLGAEAQVIRAMPNTPTAVGAGITALYAPDSISQAHKISAEAFFSASGSYIWLTEEEQMHAVTALSGSGPAYFFYFIEALAAAGTSLGLSETDSYKLAIETCKGAGAYASACYPSQSVASLRENVTSPGGTTAAGLAALQQNDLKGIASQVLEKAYKTSKKLDI